MRRNGSGWRYRWGSGRRRAEIKAGPEHVRTALCFRWRSSVWRNTWGNEATPPPQSVRLTKAGTATVTYSPVPQRLLPDIVFHFLVESRIVSNVLFCVVSTLFLSYAAIVNLKLLLPFKCPFCLGGSDTIEENTVNSLILIFTVLIHICTNK